MSGATTVLWIGLPAESGIDTAPLLRRVFTLESTVVSATLRICGLGYHEAWINGQRVGDHVLDPAQTDYGKRVLYVSHDVTALLQKGPNCLGVMLGNGWYNQDRVWSKTGLSYGKPRLWAELEVTLTDGSTQTVRSDQQWRCAAGPVTDDNIYAGECYDARLEVPGWNEPGFNHGGWLQAAQMDPPGGELQPQEMPPMRRIEELKPAAIHACGDGRWLVDMGQNFSGWARIRVAADSGTCISMRFAEAVDADGNIDTASTGTFATGVEQIDRYTCKGGGVEIWEPRFTYHGFRYVELTGWPGKLTADDITGVVVHTDLPVAGRFECSDERLNRLHAMALWTHRSNIHGLPEDCPARERCGWLGDANLIAEFSMWNYDAKSFWEKYLDDIETARSLNKGIPANIAPGKRGCGRNANPDWAAAFILIPWYVHVQSGDLTVLQKHWDGMQQLFTHFADKAENGILPGGYGDWFDPGSESICTHTPPTLTTTLWFHECAKVMASTARLLLQNEQAERYEVWVAQIRQAFLARFYDKEKGSFGSQAADAMTLQFSIVPEGEKGRVVDSLVRDILKRDTHLNVGIMGIRYLFEVLSRNGQGELALALMHQDTYPSFGDLIRRGATTLWEYWGEPELDKMHGARSLNHPMFGGYDNWFFNTLAGIRPDPAQAGFRHFFLEPHPAPGLDWVQASHNAPMGLIKSAWRHHNGGFEWTVIVPPGSTATATLPFTKEVQVLESGTHQLMDRRLVS
jgi:alpha-L-rhamnosidase